LDKVNVLVVDDEEAVKDVLEEMVESALENLDRKEYNVDLASDGYEAIERVKEKSFAIIFLDIKMPGINGIETFKEIKKISPHSVVVMITGYGGVDLVEKAMEEGAYALLHKPFHSNAIFNIIEEILEDYYKV